MRRSDDAQVFPHEPDDYSCPFCALVEGRSTLTSDQADIVYRDDHTTAFMASKNWPNNRFHILVVSNEHIENIYVLPAHIGGAIMETVRRVAIAMKQVYGCSGVSLRQHNEPDGGQDVWHFHMHVFPRYRRDMLNLTRGRISDPERRQHMAEKIRSALRQIDQL